MVIFTDAWPWILQKTFKDRYFMEHLLSLLLLGAIFMWQITNSYYFLILAFSSKQLVFLVIYVTKNISTILFYEASEVQKQMFFKIGILKNFAIFTVKYLCWSLFLIKLESWKRLKRESNRGVSLWALQNF